MFFEPAAAELIRKRNVVHYLIYRDPRDVVVSEAHYLRDMNRWHRLHPHFRRLDSIGEAIALSITGLGAEVPGVDYPDIGARFARYNEWLGHENCFAMRYEDLMSDRRPQVVRDMAQFYADRSETACDVESCVGQMLAQVAPHKSHTFRAGRKAGWQAEFTEEHRRLFERLAGGLLVELGYEADHSWARSVAAMSS